MTLAAGGPAPGFGPVERRWVLAGGVIVFSTSPGQTMFLAQFAPAFRAEFGLSHGELGLFFTGATLLGAMVLASIGGLADRLGVLRFFAASAAALTLCAALMATQGHVALFFVALAGLRCFGQGLLFHAAMTGMSRWFDRLRGRAVSLAAMGFSTGEALLPFLVTLGIAAVGWRNVWLLTALAVAALVVPLVLMLLRDAPGPGTGRGLPAASAAAALADWPRGRVLRDPLFWTVLPLLMAPPMIGTLFFFHQAHLVADKGWSHAAFVAFIPLMSATVVATALAGGALVDRFGSHRVVPWVLLPMAAACAGIALGDAFLTVPAVLVGFGLTNGLAQVCANTLWAEIYGVTHVGAIRSAATAGSIAAFAAGPGIAGVALDRQAWGYGALCLGLTLLVAVARPRLAARAAEARAGRDA